MSGELLQTDLQRCDGCRRGFLLLLILPDGDRLYGFCARCWRVAGEPPPRPATMDHTREEEIRKQMQRRGGTDRHMVRNGKT